MIQIITPDNEFWLDHKARLRGYIAGRVSDADAVDDILQDVYLKALTNQDTVRGSLAGWLYRIARNTVIDHYRARKPQVELSEDLAAPEADGGTEAELSRCLEPLIADLPETYQSALILSELEGLTQKEVAERLGISLSGAKSRVQRGREKLRLRLLDCCHVEVGAAGIVDYEPRGDDCGGCE